MLNKDPSASSLPLSIAQNSLPPSPQPEPKCRRIPMISLRPSTTSPSGRSWAATASRSSLSVCDRLDFFYNQGQCKYFQPRVTKYNSTVIRTNSIPGPFCADDRMVALCDAISYRTTSDPMNTLLGSFTPSLSFTRGYRVCAYLDPSEPKHTLIKQVSCS